MTIFVLMLGTCTSLLLAASTLDTLTVNSWYPMRPTGDFPTSGGDVHTVCDTAGNMYMFGGCLYGNSAGGSHTNDVYRFEIATGATVKLSGCSNNRYDWKGGCQSGHAYDSKRNVIYITNAFAPACATGRSAGLFKFQCPDGPLTPVGDSGSHYMAYDSKNDLIYIASGGSLKIWDCATQKYRASTRYPFGDVTDVDMSITADSKRGLFVITMVGQYAKKAPADCLRKVYFYDPALSTWHFKEPPAVPPEGQAELAYDPINDNYVYFGGEVSSFVWVYDYDKNIWIEMPKNGRAYNDNIDKYANVWPAARHKHAWCYDHKNKVFVNWGGGQWAAKQNTDYDNAGPTPLWIYKPLPKDTQTITKIDFAPGVSRLEQYTKTPFTVTAYYQGGASRVVTSFTGFSLSDTSFGSANSGTHFIALLPGQVKLTANYWGITDSQVFTIDTTTLLPDSLRVSPDTVSLMAGDSLVLSATGYYHADGALYSHSVRTLALWTTDNTRVATASLGTILGTGRGTASVTAAYKGQQDLTFVKVMPRLSTVYRVNFGCSSVPPMAGWLADNGGVYSASKGWGWNNANGDCRSDRDGNILLKTFINAGTPQIWRVDIPDGAYLIRMAMGDNQYDGSWTKSWIAQGSDTLMRHSGKTNTIVDKSITVSGGSGLRITINGKVNYLIVISDEGTKLSEVADDFQTGDFLTSAEKTNDQRTTTSSFEILPNPFNPVTCIRISSATLNHPFKLRIFNTQGREIANLTDAVDKQGLVRFNAYDLSSGIYIAKLYTKERVTQQKLILVR